MPPLSSNIVTLNVGGRIFQTTPQTLALAGERSPLSNYSADGVLFIDRDPDLFSVILSMLRTNRLPSNAAKFDVQDLSREARFYGLDQVLMASISDASNFDPFDLQKSSLLPLNGRDYPSALSATPSGSVHVAHGCKITSFDWSLRLKSTVLTCFPAVDSLLALSPSTAAAGAVDFPGLQIIDLQKGLLKKTLHWENGNSSSSSKSTVQGIEASEEYLFGSFETCRRNASVILAFDLVSGSPQPAAEIGRQEIYGADQDSAFPATHLKWAPGRNILMAAGSHSGPSGQRGIIRLWDLRCCSKPVWEKKDTADCFSDVTIVDNLSSIFKVGVNSGELYMADMRKLDAGDSWICMGDAETPRNKKEGAGCKIGGYGNQVFCTKGAGVEMWSEVVMETKERVMKRNLLGRSGGPAEAKITFMAFGGARMVLARKGIQAVEIWESLSR